MTTYYQHNDGVPQAQVRGTSTAMRAEFDLITAGFVGVDATLATMLANIATRGVTTGQAWTGNQDFTGAVVTVATPGAADYTQKPANTSWVDTYYARKASPTFTGTVTVPTPVNPTDASTKAYVDSTAFSAALPNQTGNAGKFVTTNGTSASWAVATPPTGATIFLSNNFGAF